MQKEGLVSFVICTYNRSQLLEKTLESLIPQIKEKEIELIVVDNNSTDQTELLISKYSSIYSFVKYYKEIKQGIAFTRNAGWKYSNSQYIAYIDDDIRVGDFYVDTLIELLKFLNPSASALGGRILPWYEETPPNWFSDEIEIRSWGMKAKFLKQKTGFSGANMIIKRSLLKEYNGFDEQYGMSGDKIALGEEPQFFLKIYDKHPYFYYDPRLTVYHFVPKQSLRLKYLLKRSYIEGFYLGQMQNITWRKLKYFRILFITIVKVIMLFLSPLFGKRSYKQELVLSMLDIAYKYGIINPGMIKKIENGRIN